MGTRSRIAIKTKDSIKSIYCHWNGYLSYNGKLLLNNYNDEVKINELIALGSLSLLYESIEKPNGHSFDKPVEGYTVTYYRDRGEELRIEKHNSVLELVNFFKNSGDEEFLYLFDCNENKWKYMHYDSKRWTILTNKNTKEKK